MLVLATGLQDVRRIILVTVARTRSSESNAGEQWRILGGR